MLHSPRHHIYLLCLMAVVILLSTTGCDEETTTGGDNDVGNKPGPVVNLEMMANSDGSMIRLQWEEPVTGSPVIDGYRVSFKNTPDSVSSYPVTVDSVTSLFYIHDPSGSYGNYWVTVYNSAGEGPGEKRTFDHVIRRSTWDAYDIHSGNDSGLNFADGYNQTFSMINSEILKVDIYSSNNDSSWASTPYYFKAPYFSQLNPDNSVAFPTEEYRLTTCLDMGTELPDLVTSPAEIAYTNNLEVQVNHFYAVRTEDASRPAGRSRCSRSMKSTADPRLWHYGSSLAPPTSSSPDSA